MAVLQERVAKKEINATEMRIKSATGEKTVKNVETCVYNTGYCEWLCVRVTLRMMQ
jgi:hypothetical protein